MIANGNGNKNGCDHENDILAYVYGEMVAAQASNFELHLEACLACKEDFAAISETRLSVLEWREEALSRLSTPAIVVPYSDAKLPAENLSGSTPGIRALLSIFDFPVMAAAGLLVVLILGFIALRYLDDDTHQSMVSNEPNVVEPVVNPAPPTDAVTENPKPSDLATFIRETDKAEKSTRTVVKASPRKIRTATKSLDRRERTDAPSISDAPVLSTYQAEDDKSLRLSDLFADIEG